MNIQNKILDLQKQFAQECTFHNKVPDMKTWTNYIRAIIPTGPIYVLNYIDNGKIKGSFFQWHDLIWPSNQKNDPSHRIKYFHVSSYDSNIWILKKEYRFDSSTIRALLKAPIGYYIIGL